MAVKNFRWERLFVDGKKDLSKILMTDDIEGAQPKQRIKARKQVNYDIDKYNKEY